MRRWWFSFVLFAFLAGSVVPLPARAQEVVLPRPGVLVPLSAAYHAPVLTGIKVHPDNPFRFDFICDTAGLPSTSPLLQREYLTLIKYFLTSLTIPEREVWVNLSPYEKDRVIPEHLGRTEMGRVLLGEDYLLKQIAASLIYPEDEIGKKFWQTVYARAAARFGGRNVPVRTFNKVWIMPEKAVVYENAKTGAAYIVESKLKVMLEQDYLALSRQGSMTEQTARRRRDGSATPVRLKGVEGTNEIGSQIIREAVIPQLTREVNEGKNFARLRQVYQSLILAAWYKRKIRDSILALIYKDRRKTAGITHGQAGAVQAIYEQYLRAFKKGVFDYIKDEEDPLTRRPSPRKYFSGGVQLQLRDSAMRSSPAQFPAPALEITDHFPGGNIPQGMAQITVNVVGQKGNRQFAVGPAPSVRQPPKADRAMNTALAPVLDVDKLPEEFKKLALTPEERAKVIEALVKIYRKSVENAESLKSASADPTLYSITIREAQRYLTEFVRVFNETMESKAEGNRKREDTLDEAVKQAGWVFTDMFPPQTVDDAFKDARIRVYRALQSKMPTLFIRPINSLDSLEQAIQVYLQEFPGAVLETVTGTPFTDSMQLIGAKMPVEGEQDGQQPLRYEAGVLSRMVELAWLHPDKTYILKIDQMEAIAPKVRAQLNEFLLRGELNVPEGGKRLVLPENMRIIASISSEAVIGDEAFYERFVRKLLVPVSMQNFKRVLYQRYGFAEFVQDAFGKAIEHNPEISYSQWLILAQYVHGSVPKEGMEVIQLVEGAVASERALFLRPANMPNVNKLALTEQGLEINGVPLPVNSALKKVLEHEVGLSRDTQGIAEALHRATGMIMTDDVLNVLSAAARTLRYGNGMLRLEGPTGAGKTYVAEALARIMGVSYYGEPIHGESKQSRWLGQFKVNSRGDYMLDQDTPFLGILKNGGVMALSELNTAVKDGYAKLGWWLVRLAMGEKTIHLNEYPRPLTGEAISPTFKRDPNSLIIIDINPSETYQVRGQLPPMLLAYTPVVRVSGKLSKEQLKEVALTHLEKLPPADREFYAERLAEFHFQLQEAQSDSNRTISKDKEFIVTLRQLNRAGEMVLRLASQGMRQNAALQLAVRANYVLSFPDLGDQEILRKDLVLLARGRVKRDSVGSKRLWHPRYEFAVSSHKDRVAMVMTPPDVAPSRTRITMTTKTWDDRVKGMFGNEFSMPNFFGALYGHVGQLKTSKTLIDPRGRKVVVAGTDANTVLVWTEITPNVYELCELPGHEGMVTGVDADFNTQGELLIASGDSKGVIRLWQEGKGGRFKVKSWDGYARQGQETSIILALTLDKDGEPVIASVGSERDRVDFWKQNGNWMGYSREMISGVEDEDVTEMRMSYDAYGDLRGIVKRADHISMFKKTWKGMSYGHLNQDRQPALFQGLLDEEKFFTLLRYKQGKKGAPGRIEVYKQQEKGSFSVSAIQKLGLVQSMAAQYTPEGKLVIVTNDGTAGLDLWVEEKSSFRKEHIVDAGASLTRIRDLDMTIESDGKVTIFSSAENDNHIRIWDGGTVKARAAPKDILSDLVLYTKIPVMYGAPARTNSLETLRKELKKLVPNVYIEPVRCTLFANDFTFFGGNVLDQEAAKSGRRAVKWADGIIPRIDKLARAHPERLFVIAFDNFHYLSPTLAVALNALLQERIYYSPESKEVIKLPDNVRFVATTTLGADFKISLAEQNRWLRIFDTGQTLDEQPGETGEHVVPSVEALNVSFPVADTQKRPLDEELLVPIPEMLAIEHKMVSAMKQGGIAILEGDPGGGKTDIAIDVAQRFGLESALYSAHGRSNLSDFIGNYTQDENGKFVLTALPDAQGNYQMPFLQLFTHGGVFIIDEGAIGKRAQALIAWLSQIARGDKEIVLNEHPGIEPLVLKRHKDFHMFITTNDIDTTPGRESIPVEVLEHAVRIKVSNDFTDDSYRAILRRFHERYGHGRAVDERIIEAQIKLHRAMRKFVQDQDFDDANRHLFTLRDLKGWTQAFHDEADKGKDWRPAFAESFRLLYLAQFREEVRRDFITGVLGILETFHITQDLLEPRPFAYARWEPVVLEVQPDLIKPELRSNETTTVTDMEPSTEISSRDITMDTVPFETIDEQSQAWRELKRTINTNMSSTPSHMQVLQIDGRTVVISFDKMEDRSIHVWDMGRSGANPIPASVRTLWLPDWSDWGRTPDVVHAAVENGKLIIACGTRQNTIVVFEEQDDQKFKAWTLGKGESRREIRVIKMLHRGDRLIMVAHGDMGFFVWERDRPGVYRGRMLESKGLRTRIQGFDALDIQGRLTLVLAHVWGWAQIVREQNDGSFKYFALRRQISPEDISAVSEGGRLSIVSGSRYGGLDIFREQPDGQFVHQSIAANTWKVSCLIKDGLLTIFSRYNGENIYRENADGTYSLKTMKIGGVWDAALDGDILTWVDVVQSWNEKTAKSKYKIGFFRDDETVVRADVARKTPPTVMVPGSLNLSAAELRVENDLKKIFNRGFQGLMLLEPGSRDTQILSTLSQENDIALSHLESDPQMGVMDLFGGLFPVLDGEDNPHGRDFRNKPGFITRYMLHPDGKKRLLVIHNIDALPERVRAALNNFLLKGYLDVRDDNGGVRRLLLPNGVQIMATLSTASQRQFSSAFFNRFGKVYVPALSAHLDGVSELLHVLTHDQGIDEVIARNIIQAVYLMVKSLEGTSLFWPSGSDYHFTVKEALLHGEFFKAALAQAQARGEQLDVHAQQRLAIQEALRVYGSRIQQHPNDLESFRVLILAQPLFGGQEEELGAGVLSQDGIIASLGDVPLPSSVNGIAPEQVDLRYRLTLVPGIVKSLASTLRGWQAGKVVSMVGGSGVAKTTMGVFLAQLMGLDYYIFSTHGESKTRDLTVALTREDSGKHALVVQEFLRRVQQGNQVIILDEANMRPEVLWVLNGIARGEKEITVEVPGEQPFTVSVGENVFFLMTMNPESFAGRGQIPDVLLENVFKMWVSTNYTDDQLKEILDHFLQARTMQAIQQKLPLLAQGQEDLGHAWQMSVKEMLDLMQNGGRKSLGGLTGEQVKELEREILEMTEVRTKIDMIRLAVHLIAPQVQVIFSLRVWWAESMDGKRIFVPLYELVDPKRSRDAVIGLILHELWHNRISLSDEEMKQIAEESSSPIREAILDPRFHRLWNAIEDVRIDHIDDPRQVGYRAYANQMITEFFQTPMTPVEIQKYLALAARNSAKTFQAEVMKYGYNGKYSEAFDQLPDDVQHAVRAVTQATHGTSLLHQACFADDVRPDFERIYSAPGQDQEKLRREQRLATARTSLTVIARDIYPIYKSLIKQRKQKQGEENGEPGEKGASGSPENGGNQEGEPEGEPIHGPRDGSAQPGHESGPSIAGGDHDGSGSGLPSDDEPGDGEPGDGEPGEENPMPGAGIPKMIKISPEQAALIIQGIIDSGNINSLPQGLRPAGEPPENAAPGRAMTEKERQKSADAIAAALDKARDQRREEIKTGERLNERLSELGNHGRRLAKALMELFRVPEEPDVEEAATGIIINAVRYLLRHPEPFDEEVEQLGKPNLALDVTIDVSGSMKLGGYVPAVKKLLAIFMSTFEQIGQKKAEYGISMIHEEFDDIKGFAKRYSRDQLNAMQEKLERWIDMGGRPHDEEGAASGHGGGIHLYNTVTGIIEKFKKTGMKNKLALVVTDGEDTGRDLQLDPVTGAVTPSKKLKEKLDEARRLGIEIVGVGFNTRDTEVFGPGHFIQLEKENAEAVVDILIKLARIMVQRGSLPTNVNLATLMQVNLNRATQEFQRATQIKKDDGADSAQLTAKAVAQAVTGISSARREGYTPGGIDLAAADRVLQTHSSGQAPMRFTMDPAQLQQLQDADGFAPIIVNVRPLKDLRLFLGIAASGVR